MALKMHTTPRSNELKENIRETRYTTKKEFLSEQIKKMMDVDIIRDLANKAMAINPELTYEQATKFARREYFKEEVETIEDIELPFIEIEDENLEEEISEISDVVIEETKDILESSENLVDQMFDPESLFVGITDDLSLNIPGAENIIDVSDDNLKEEINETSDVIIEEPNLNEGTEDLIEDLTINNNLAENILNDLPDDIEIKEEKELVDSTDLIEEIENKNLESDLLETLPDELESLSSNLLESLPEEIVSPENEEQIAEEKLSFEVDNLEDSLLKEDTNLKTELENLKENLVEDKLSNTLTNGLVIDFLDEPVLQKSRK